MVTLSDLMQSELDAINLYYDFLSQHGVMLTPAERKKIKAIIADEKDHWKIDNKIKQDHS